MGRLQAMIIKEMWAVLRDPKSRIVLVVPPLLQLFIFTFATTLDVRNVDLGLLTRSEGRATTELVQRLEGSPYIGRVVQLTSERSLQRAVDDQKVIGALVITQGFDRNVAAGRPATIGLVLDGRRSNAAQIVGGYVQQIAGNVGADVQTSATPPPVAPGRSEVTNWYNPALDYVWFTIPSLIAIIVMVAGLSITSQSVARERELGTFDQLMVSPLRVHEILIGKMIPPLLIGLFNATVYLILGPLIFGVPFRGSLLLFYPAMIVYMLALIGVGMLVSAASKTQQQAFLGSFLATTPLMLLSGYASPIDNMPGWLQTITLANPVRYFIIIVQGLFLKAMPAWAVLEQVWPMAIIAILTLSAAAFLFRARME